MSAPPFDLDEDRQAALAAARELRAAADNAERVLLHPTYDGTEHAQAVLRAVAALRGDTSPEAVLDRELRRHRGLLDVLGDDVQPDWGHQARAVIAAVALSLPTFADSLRVSSVARALKALGNVGGGSKHAPARYWEVLAQVVNDATEQTLSADAVKKRAARARTK